MEVLSPKKRPRGAHATPRDRLAAATPFKPALVGLPAQMITIPSQLSYWLNNVDGDCTVAEEAFAKACASLMAGQSELFITDQTAQTWGTANGFMNGAVILDVLEAMEKSGFQQSGVTYNNGAPQSVAWTSQSTLISAISQGPVKLGVVGDPLDAVVVSNGWFLTGVAPQSAANEDHCISLCGYGPINWLLAQLGVTLAPANTGFGVAAFTWDTIGVIDWQSFLNITFEAWLRNPTTVVGGSPVNPTPSPVTPGSPLFTMNFTGLNIAAGQEIAFRSPVAISGVGVCDVVPAMRGTKSHRIFVEADKP